VLVIATRLRGETGAVGELAGGAGLGSEGGPGADAGGELGRRRLCYLGVGARQLRPLLAARHEAGVAVGLG
jgi:hypothetical protein